MERFASGEARSHVRMILENLLCRKKANAWKTNIVIIFVMVMHMEKIYMYEVIVYED